MIEQTDERRIWGLDSRYSFFHRVGPFLAQSTLGGGFRADNIQVGLWHAPDRRRQAPRVDSEVLERNLSLWVQEEVSLSPRLRFIGGLRDEGRTPEEIAAALIAANYDPGHLDSQTLPRAVGGELGARARLWEHLNLGAAAWWLDLDREYVYVGDTGTTELSGRTRRVGLDLEGRCQVLPWLWADADANISKGVARDEPADADEIPLAPTLTSIGGLTARHPRGYEGSLRYRHIGERPANEDNSVRALGYTVVDLAAGYRRGAYRLDVHVENLLDTEWNEAQFATESRLRDETEPVTEIHFTPGNPRNMRIELSRFF